MDVSRPRLYTGMDVKLGHGALGSCLHRGYLDVPHQSSVDPLVEPGGQVLR